MDTDYIKNIRQKYYKIFNNKIAPNLRIYDSEMKKMKAKDKFVQIMAFIIVSVVALFVIKLCWANAEQDLRIGLVFMTLLFYIIAFCLIPNSETLRKKLKSKIIPELMKAFDNFEWINDSEGLIEFETLQESKLFKTGLKNRTVDDSFSAVCGNVSLKIDEVWLNYSKNEDDFNFNRALIIMADFNKHFKGHTIVRHLPMLFDSKYQEVKLEDINFSKQNKIYSTDQVEARYILTTSFIERIKNIKKIFSTSEVRISFKDDKMLIALGLSLNTDLFEFIDVNKSLMNTSSYVKFLDEIIAILEIVEELKLNQNIGL